MGTGRVKFFLLETREGFFAYLGEKNQGQPLLIQKPQTLHLESKYGLQKRLQKIIEICDMCASNLVLTKVREEMCTS